MGSNPSSSALLDTDSVLCYTVHMDRKLKGRLAEAKAIAWFVESGYEVYIPLHDCTSVDLVVIKEGVTQRVSVKYTSQKEHQKWKVRLSNNSRQRDGSSTERPFDKDSVDLLAAYIGPEDRVVIREVDFNAKYAIAIA
jgi:hypothetical protein